MTITKPCLRCMAGLLLIGLLVSGCGQNVGLPPTVLPGDSPFLPGHNPNEFTLLVRLAHVTDTHAVDAESPARLAEFDVVVDSAWRPQEAYSTQLLDGTIRAINRYHENVGTIDFLIHTGDATDNTQGNELGWFLQIMDGQMVDPLSGPDDRDVTMVPEPLLDPYQPFQAEGIYTQGLHGPLPTIPWYATVGNHDVFASGNFPIVDLVCGHRVSPLPLWDRPGFLLPSVLVPDGSWTNAPVSPANPGPPALFHTPVWVAPNAGRAYFSRQEYLEHLFASQSAPAGHGFTGTTSPPTWYSRMIQDRVRLIVLDTTDVPLVIRSLPYSEGAIGQAQLGWFRDQLNEAKQQGQWVIVASHHTSDDLLALYGSAILPEAFRALLNEFDNVILHLAGHTHVNRVLDRDGYIEIVTGSTLDYPQTARIIEIHQKNDANDLLISYTTISHLDSIDPLSRLRQVAFELAGGNAGATAARLAQKAKVPPPEAGEERGWLGGSLSDREGAITLRRGH
jgi:3',5'-cyclic AMP phosphodiesterase CpdA